MPAPKKKSAKHSAKFVAQKTKRKVVRKKPTTNTRKHPHQEDKLNMALDAASMGIWEWTFKSNEVVWSDKVFKIFHLSPHEFDGTFDAYNSLIHPDDHQRVIQTINESIETGKKYFVQHRILVHGVVYWIEAVGEMITGRSKKPIKMMGTVQDITELKRLDLEREDWKIRYELLAASSGQVIYDYTLETGNILWSGIIREVLGYETSELGDIKTWGELIHPEDREHAYAELEKAEKSISAYDVIYRFRKKTGDYVYMHDKGFFLANVRNQPYRMLGSMQDISDRIKAEQEIWRGSQFRKSIEATMPGVLFVYDVKNKRNIYSNGRLPLGYSHEEINALGTAFIPTVVHPDDLAKFPVWSNENFETVYHLEYRMRHRNGNWLWFTARTKPFEKDKDGNVTQIIGIATDITEQRNTVESLRESEKRFRNLVQDLSVGVIIYSPTGELRLCNKSALELLGRSEEQLTGDPKTITPLAVVNEDGSDFPIDKLPVPLVIRTQKPVRGVVFGISHPQKVDRAWLLVNAHPIFNDRQELIEIICTIIDISERRRIEIELKESELRFRTLQRASFGGIGLHDHGVIVDCNQGLCDITGYPMNELVGKNGVDLIAPEYQSQVITHIKSGYSLPYDVEGIRKDGTRYFLEIHGKEIPYHGRTIRVTEFRDISSRKVAEEKIVEQNTRLLAITEDFKRKNEQLEEFAQIVSHNLRSPVGNILTLLNFFESAETSEEKSEYLALLKEAGTTTLNTLSDLTEILRIKQDRNIEKQTLEFKIIFNHARAMLNAKIVETGAEVTANFEEAPTLHYPGIYLESIFLNLLSNALKYVRTGVRPVIQFKTYLYNNQLILEASDNGLGINLERYGHQVFKLRKTFHRHPESRGIGLFMIKNQIEAMGGEISLTSKENIGTTFFVNFNKYLHDNHEKSNHSLN